MTRAGELPARALDTLFAAFGLTLCRLADDASIPGSFWGPPEAGLVRNRLYWRDDTPVHSVLHEACHWICMDANRRAALDTDAGGDDAEEAAVCFLQVVLAPYIDGYSQARLFRDMDNWGYSFRLGAARVWFEQDAEDSRRWLESRGLVNPDLTPWIPRSGQPSAAR